MNREKNLEEGKVMELTFPLPSAESAFQNLDGEYMGVIYGPPQASSSPERNHPGIFKKCLMP